MLKSLTIATILAVSAVATGAYVAARAAVSPPATQVCPIAGGLDPDFVTFEGPATIVGDGANHLVTLFASEEESARNLVTLSAVATARKNGRIAATVPIVASADGLHDTSIQLSLTGTPGLKYVIDWIATFDFGPHVCAWAFPGHAAFTVTVGP